MKPKYNVWANLTTLAAINLTSIPALSAADFYWDTNGATPGAGGFSPRGTWASGGTTWSTDPLGVTATSGFTPLPGVVNTSGVLSVTWTKAAGYTGTYGTDYWVETSATLNTGSWTAEIADPGVGFTVTFPSATEVKFTFPAGPPYSGKKFARLKVTGP
jgi:hypothetical protein